MAKKTIRPIDLERTVNELIQEYGEEVYSVVSESINEVMDKAVDDLHAANRFAPDGHPSGAYAKSWEKIIEPASRLTTKVIVRNKEHYRLTHLLEKGHAKQNGGRVKAYPHIAPVNDEAQRNVFKLIEEKLK